MENTEVEKRSGVTGLCIDDNNTIYFSYTENEDAEKSFLRKCKDYRTFVYDVSLPHFVRGVGKDDHGNLYVLCSSNKSKVIKLDKNLNPVRKTSSSCGKYFGVAFGILVTPAYVFVCARLSQKICILDLNLKLLYCLRVGFNPIGITKLHSRYFVASRGVIGVMEINFEQKKFQVKTYRNMKSDGGTECFKPNVEFRGICADENYLYVTERDDSTGGRILCLEFDKKQFVLKYFYQTFCKDCKEKKCCPIVITHHKGTIIYGQAKSWGGNFHLLRLNYDGKTATSDKVIDEP